KETKKPALCHLSKGGFCSRARLKISKGQVVFFEKITQKISTFKPLPIFILSVLSSLPKARLSKNKIFIVFRFSSVTDKTTQKRNKKTCPLPPQQRGVLLSCSFKNQQGTGSIF